MNEFWRDFIKGQRVTFGGVSFGYEQGEYVVVDVENRAWGQVISVEQVIDVEYTVKRTE